MKGKKITSKNIQPNRREEKLSNKSKKDASPKYCESNIKNGEVRMDMDWGFFDDEDFDFDIDIDPEEGVYPLNIVSRLLHMQTWTINELIEEGLLHPKMIGKRKKLFSHNDMKRLNIIKFLIEEKGVNINGVKVIFQMQYRDKDNEMGNGGD